MTATLTAFADSPDQGRGLARDMRVRWALEEVGVPYEVRLVPLNGLRTPEHLARQPFGQIPALEDGALQFFESGAIVLHIAQSYPGLLSEDAEARAQDLSWIFAAVSTIEPVVVELETARFTEGDRPWIRERLELIAARIRKRLAQLSDCIGQSGWIGDQFSAADLLMVNVLQRLAGSPLLEEQSNLASYVQRACERSAYQRAFAAQLRDYQATAGAQR